MRHLLEKKNELIHRSRKLRNDRALEIERKVKDYRENLESEQIEGLDELDEVIAALDKVVAYCSDEESAEEVEYAAEAAEQSAVEEATRAKFDFGRPGVHTITTPKR